MKRPETRFENYLGVPLLTPFFLFYFRLLRSVSLHPLTPGSGLPGYPKLSLQPTLKLWDLRILSLLINLTQLDSIDAPVN